MDETILFDGEGSGIDSSSATGIRLQNGDDGRVEIGGGDGEAGADGSRGRGQAGCRREKAIRSSPRVEAGVRGAGGYLACRNFPRVKEVCGGC